MLLTAVLAAAWTFESAPLARTPATGVEHPDGTHELRLPERDACGWWETTATFQPGKGVRVTATVDVSLDEASDALYNDLALFVQWNFPNDGKDRSKSGNGIDKGKFYQRDFVSYTDRRENDRLVRTFDETFATPKACDSAMIQVIGKWHPMTCRIRDLKLENVARPQPRLVRCVVGNPHEGGSGFARLNAARRKKGAPLTGAEVMTVRLGQIEETLTNIFAHVEHPDIILFSECFSGAGARNPAEVAEAIPGGPSWKLAEKYAVRYRCNIAMNVKERDERGVCHNTVFVCDRQGKLAGRYRKEHLTSGEYQQGLCPDGKFTVFNLDFGRVGALVCWDNWFSESIKLVKRNGAELLLFPLAGCAPDHVDICFPARAIDSGLPILVAMRQGHLPNGIIDRDGKWIAKTYEDNGFAWADIDLAERKRTFWLSVGPGMGDPYELYYDESRPELYEKFDWRQPRR